MPPVSSHSPGPTSRSTWAMPPRASVASSDGSASSTGPTGAVRHHSRKAQSTGSDRHLASAHGELASHLADAGRAAESVEEYGRAIDLAGRAQFTLLEAQLRTGRGKLLAASDPAAAEGDYRRALEILEATRHGLRTLEDRASFQLQSEAAYRELIAILARDPGRATEVFRVAERARSRDFLSEGGQARTVSAVDAEGLSHVAYPCADSCFRNSSGVSLRNSQKLSSGSFRPSRLYGV